jgi:hypothetical protein
MIEKAQELWETFKGELTQPATEDQRQALATAIREIAMEVVAPYYQYAEWELVDKICNEILDIADKLDEMDTLETDHSTPE